MVTVCNGSTKLRKCNELPSIGQPERWCDFFSVNKLLHSLQRSIPHQLCLLSLDAYEQFGGGFVVGVLGGEFSPDGQVEDGLAELLDVL